MINIASEHTTNLVRLNPLQKKDANSLFKLINENREHLKYWLPWVKNTQKLMDTRDYIEEAQHRYAQGKAVYMGIWYDNVLVGNINLQPIDTNHKKAGIGYWLDKNQEGKGLMLDACHLIITYAFERLYLNRLEIATALENKRSRAIPEKLGFKQEGILREYQMIENKPVDFVVYGLLRKEWQ